MSEEMYVKKAKFKSGRLRALLVLAAACALLCACSQTESTVEAEPTETPITDTSVTLAAEEIDALCAQSPLYVELQRISVTDCVTAQQLSALRAAFPEAELSYSVEVCGQSVSSAETELDLSALSGEDCDAAAEALELLPNIARITLPPELTLEQAALFALLPQEPAVEYTFELYGKEFSMEDELIVLSKTRITDHGEELSAALPSLPRCRSVELEDCGLTNEECAAIRESFPEVKIVWRIDFGPYSVRTDETRILASIKGVCLRAADVEPLKYCTDVKYLDLGHNTIEDISFVSSMTELEVAILAINYWSDASPLENCQKLEYLEIFNTQCTDLTPISKLPALKHLNIVWLKNLEDISPLYDMTGLERLWVGCVNKVPEEQLEEIQERLPDTEVNVTTDTPTSEGWRDGERYELLCEQMGYNLVQPYSMR